MSLMNGGASNGPGRTSERETRSLVPVAGCYFFKETDVKRIMPSGMCT